jgi:3-(3-hydroxy-phenyl)propionate hydroxylase
MQFGVDTLYDVAIVGFGPTGAVAASLLGAQGLKTVVCDRALDVYDMPRAFALDHEIVRVFQQIGVEQQVLQFAEPFTPSEFFGVDGQMIKRFTTVDPPYPLGYVPSLVFSQPPVERILRQHVQELSTVSVALGCEVTDLVQAHDSVTLSLANRDGSSQQIRARYVLACDGASSTVRSKVGIELQDLGFDQAWLVVDALVNAQGLAKLPQTSVQYCEPQRPCTFLIGTQNHRRWEISINPGEDPAVLATPEATWKLLSRWITPEDGTLWRQASYRFHALVAQQWRAGRVFVAGDAAHQQPPFLGQGMCQGIRDVANVSWKLGAVLRGDAGDELLDSYGIERKAHVTALTTRIKGIGQLVGERDIPLARARDVQLLAACDGVVKSVPRQDVQPHLETGILSVQASNARGSIFPQPWVLQGAQKVLLDRVTGYGWRLVLDAEFSGDPLELAKNLEGVAGSTSALHLVTVRMTNTPQPDAWCEADGVLAAWFNRNQCLAALVRPDHYVYGVASAHSEIRQLVQDAAKQVVSQRQLDTSAVLETT